MKAVIFAGGLGTRLSEETASIPKPMVEIGGKPIILEIMEIYSKFGVKEFVILLGYKGDILKKYFRDLHLNLSDLEIDFANNQISSLNQKDLGWKVTLIDTGKLTMTGCRLHKSKHLLDGNDFFLTYGDGLANVDIHSLKEFHKKQNKILTMTSVQPDGRFGSFESDEKGLVRRFLEKPKGDGSWINGGFFVCSPRIFDYVYQDEQLVFEQQPMQRLAEDGELVEFKHNGFWKCMDTLKDKNDLNDLAALPNPPWKA
ncbi:glucose-1-phosphate cytidylyltransferase [bacterium]|nr:glucose-1-phosphate cytidylyltransferase [bacterium]